MNEIGVRWFKESDLFEVLELFYQTIEEINSQDYTPAQVAAWQGKSKEQERIVKWRKQLLDSKTLVAYNQQQKIVGFLEMEQTGELNLFFVHAKYQRQGIGRKLMKQLLQELEHSPLSSFCLEANVSITAKPFFETFGFEVICQQQVTINGQEFINYRMEKHLNHNGVN